MPTLDAIIQMVITGAAIGMGSACGTYFANRAFLKHIDKFLDYKKGGGANNDKNTGEKDREQRTGLCYR